MAVDRAVARAMTGPEAPQRLREGGLIADAMAVDEFNKPVIEKAGLVAK